MTEWLGQNGEDRIIAAYLAERHPGLVGRVLDIGAHDGWSLSNTARLLERGWGGTLIEASPRPLAKLIERWGGREDIEIVGAAVVNAERTWESGSELQRVVRWFDDAGAACHGGEAFLGTTEIANVEKWRKATNFRRASLAYITPQDVASGAFPRWDVWSIDVEGTSVQILDELSACVRGLRDGPERLPLLVVVEHDDRHADIQRWCARYLYRVAHVNAENVIAVR